MSFLNIAEHHFLGTNRILQTTFRLMMHGARILFTLHCRDLNVFKKFVGKDSWDTITGEEPFNHRL